MFFFDQEACGVCEDLSFPTRDGTHTPALEGEVLITGLTGNLPFQ